MKKKSIIELNKLLKLNIMSARKMSNEDDSIPRSKMSLSFLLDDPVYYEGRINGEKAKVPPEQKSEAPTDPRLEEKMGRVPLPPRHWTLGPHERVTQTADPSEMMENLKEILEGLYVDYKPTETPFELNCSHYPKAARESFRVSFYMTPRGIVLEVWRLYGDWLTFRDIYNRLIDAAVEKKLVVPRDPTKFSVRKDPTLSKEWKRMEKKWNDARTEEEISNALEPLICMAGSRYRDVSSRAVESLCEMSKDAKAASWLVKNGHVADAKKLAGSEWEVLHIPAVSWIANMARNKELCESLATPGVLKIMAHRLGSKCKQVVREASRALKNLSVVLGPKKILSAANIFPPTVRKMMAYPDRRTKAAWRELLGN